MSGTVKGRYIQKHDVEANWVRATNFVPLNGEIIIYEKDGAHALPRVKIGDGVTLVSELAFADSGKANLVIESSDQPTNSSVGDEWDRLL